MLSNKFIFYLVVCVSSGNGLPNILSKFFRADQCSNSDLEYFPPFITKTVSETLKVGDKCTDSINSTSYRNIEFISSEDCNKYFSIDYTDEQADIILKESLDGVFDKPDKKYQFDCTIKYTCDDASTKNRQTFIYVLPENDNGPRFLANNTAEVTISKQQPAGPEWPIPGFNIMAEDIDFIPPGDFDHNMNVIICEVDKSTDPYDLILCTTNKIEDGVYAFSLSLKRPIEADVPNPYNFSIKAHDNGTQQQPGQNEQEVSINFKASDQFAPAFEQLYYKGSIPDPKWSSPVPLVTIKATDPDTEIDDPIIYSIDQDELAKTCDNNCFTINETSGELSWSNSLKDDVIKSRLVEVLVTATEDNEELRRSSTTVIIITIAGDNHPPKFNQESYNGIITADGTMLDIPFTVSDADAALSPTHDFRLIGEPGHTSNFEINQDNNKLKLNQSFDMSSSNLPSGGRVSFILQVTDKDDDTKMDRSLVTITYPWNQRNPKFTTPKLHGTVRTGEAVVVLDNTLSAVDGDEMKSQIEYELLDPADSGEFSLDQTDPDDVKINFSGESSTYRHAALVVKAFKKHPNPGTDARIDLATVYVEIGDVPTTSTTTPQPSTTTTTTPPTTTNTACPTCPPPAPCTTPTTSTITISTSTSTSTDSSTSSCPPAPPCTTIAPFSTTTDCPTCPPPCPTTSTPSTTLSTSSPTSTSTSLATSTSPDSSTSSSCPPAPPCTTVAPSPTTTGEIGDETVKFISGDAQSGVQNVGYPSFVKLENSVPMPITRVVASCSNTVYNSHITYVITSSTSPFHVDKTTGEVFVNNAKDQKVVGDVCSSTCSITVTATLITKAGDKTDQITVTVTALDETQLGVFSSSTSVSEAEDVLDKINNNNASVWFRLVNTQPLQPNKRTTGSVLFLTARKEQDFIDKGEAASIIENMEDMDDIEDKGADISVYHPTSPPSNGGLVAAVVVLAVLLACIPLAALAVVAYKKRSAILNRLPARNNASKMDKISESGDGYEDMNYFKSDDLAREKAKDTNNKPRMGQPAVGKNNNGLMREMSTELEKRLETKQSNTVLNKTAIPSATASSNPVGRALPPAATSNPVDRNPSATIAASNPLGLGESRELQFVKPPQKKKAPVAPSAVPPSDGVRFNEKAEVVEVEKDGDKVSVAGLVSSAVSTESESSSEASTSSDDEDVTVM